MLSKGKLSICTDENGVKKIDTSELLRVFGAFKAVHHEQIDNVTDEQHVTPNRTGETSKTKQLEHEIEHLRQLVTAQQSHIDSLNQAFEKHTVTLLPVVNIGIFFCVFIC